MLTRESKYLFLGAGCREILCCPAKHNEPSKSTNTRNKLGFVQVCSKCTGPLFYSLFSITIHQVKCMGFSADYIHRTRKKARVAILPDLSVCSGDDSLSF